jgi:hypothetical protein
MVNEREEEKKKPNKTLAPRKEKLFQKPPLH